MKGIYITTRDMALTKEKEYGIYQKILAQQNELKRYSELEVYDGDWKDNLVKKVLARLPLFPCSFRLKSQNVPSHIDYLFLRFDYGDRRMVNYLRRFRELNPKAKIIVEFATFPFIWSNYPFFVRILKYKSERCAYTIQKYVDRAITYGCHTSAYGIPTIPIESGIVSEITDLKEDIVNSNVDEINVISVSSMNKVHRIDRFIDGLGEYIKTKPHRKVFFHVVGDGIEKKHLIELTKEKNLEQFVTFYGYKNGTELEEIYKKCDIAVEVLADHEMESSSLKSREYFANGLPFVTACKLSKSFNDAKDYILYLPSDDLPICMMDIIEFIDSLYRGKSKSEINSEIKSFAREKLSFSFVFKPIIDYLFTV